MVAKSMSLTKFSLLFLGGSLIICLLAAQCSNPFAPTEQSPPTDTPSTPVVEPVNRPLDLLDVVKERGYLKVGVRVWPEANFRPPLYRAPLAGLDGYEVDLAWALADGLGVGLEMAESDPRRLAGGNWESEWDIALAWLAITDNSQQNLIFSIPYAYDAGQVVVHADNETITGFEGLAGRKVGVPAFTVYQQILTGKSPSVQGQFISGPIPSGLEVVPYNHDGKALWDLAEGDGVVLDAVLHSQIVVASAIQAELPLKIVSEPLFWAPIGVAFDRGGLPAERLRVAINSTLTNLHHDGSLSDFSIERYDRDISKLP
jgi:polar amino acid transport system substrate-binding protein